MTRRCTRSALAFGPEAYWRSELTGPLGFALRGPKLPSGCAPPIGRATRDAAASSGPLDGGPALSPSSMYSAEPVGGASSSAKLTMRWRSPPVRSDSALAGGWECEANPSCHHRLGARQGKDTRIVRLRSHRGSDVGDELPLCLWPPGLRGKRHQNCSAVTPRRHAVEQFWCLFPV